MRRSLQMSLGEDGARRLPYVDGSKRLTGVNMLPAFHDSGLMLMLLGPFVAGWDMCHMSPLTFLAKPLTWLQVMSDYGAHWSAMPDFAYDLIVRRLGDDPASFLKTIDLSAVIKLGAGVGQRCRPAQLEKFLDTVAESTGLHHHPTIWMPAYGLAEHVVATAFEIDGLITSKTVPGLASSGSQFVCGVKIVDPGTLEEVEDGKSGELWLSSGSCAQGYWNKPELSRETFYARLASQKHEGRAWMRTGDTAFLEDGRLFICGRIKDMIMVGGKTYHAEDMELCVEEACAAVMRPGSVAAFSVEPEDGEEYAVVVFECYQRFEKEATEAAENARTAVARDVGVRPRRVVIVKEKSIPKTTSGKVRRSATREALLGGQLHVVFDSNVVPEKCAEFSPLQSVASPEWICTVSNMSEMTCLNLVDEECWLTRIEDEVLKSLFESGEFAKEDDHIWKMSLSSDALKAVEHCVQMIVPTTSPVSFKTTMPITLEEAVSKVQLLHVEATLIAKVRKLVSSEGSTVNSETCLVDHGITSQDAVKLQQCIIDSLGVEVDLSDLLKQDSISVLAVKILQIANREDPYDEQFVQCNFVGEDFEFLTSWKPPRLIFDAMQTFGVLVVSILVAAAIVPAYYYGLHVQWKRVVAHGTETFIRRDNPPLSHMTLDHGKTYMLGLLIPLSIPIFMLALSAIVIASKWIVIGRYRAGTIQLGSIGFLRWWLIDRLMDQWELWCGTFVKDTILINVFYRLCGSRISLTASVDAFIREFDLIQIETSSKLSGCALYARSFEQGGVLRLAPIVAERHCQILSGAVVMPGCVVEEGAILRHDAATIVGMRLARYTTYQGSPAQSTEMVDDSVLSKEDSKREAIDTSVMVTSRNHKSLCSWGLFETAKILSLGLVLYGPLLASSALVSTIFRRVDWIDWSFRYRECAYWVLAYFGGCFVSILTVIALKWLLLGRMRPGRRVASSRLRCWVVDFVWYRVVCRFSHLLFACNGCLTNLVYKALGADVALSATIATVHCISPTHIDCLKIEEGAILSGCRISCESSDGALKKVVFEGGVEVGFYTRIFSGAVIGHGAVVGHQTQIKEDERVVSQSVRCGDAIFVKKKSDLENERVSSKTTLARHVAVATVLRLVELFVLGFVCLLPAFEIAVRIFYGKIDYYKDEEYLRGINANGSRWTPPIDRNLAVLLIGPIALVASLCMSLAYRVWQRVGLSEFPETTAATDMFCVLYRDYQIMSLEIASFLMYFLRGSRLANFYMQFWGARCDSDAFVNTVYFYEAPLITIEKNAVIDDNNINIAHVLSLGRLVFRRKVVGAGAILHPAAVTWAGDVVPEGVILGPRAQMLQSQEEDLEIGRAAYPPGTYIQGSPARIVRA